MEATSTLTERRGPAAWLWNGASSERNGRPRFLPPPPRIPQNASRIPKLFEQALAHHLAGRFDQALALYGEVLELDSRSADAHNNSGAALMALGRIDDAIAHYERALSLRSGNAFAHFNLGNALAVQGRIDDAIARYRAALTLRPDYAEACNNLGHALSLNGDSEGAAALYRRAISIDPKHPGAHTNLGNILRDQGRFPEAADHYDRAIAIDPCYVEAHYDRAEIRTCRKGDPEIPVLEALASRKDLTPRQKPFVHFALAKVLEDCGDYPRAFAHFRQGNAHKRVQIRYDEPAVHELFSRVSKVFDRELLERLRGSGDFTEAPVFVLGMPRSGSTLIEQILASHPLIHGAGEREDLRAAAGAGFPENIASLDASALREMGRSYRDRMPAVSGARLRIVDKLPANFLRIGLIRLMLPNARIIHTVRHPLDTCVSCYSKLFTGGQNFSYDLGELGRYYRGYAGLMKHWRSVLPPGAMLEVAYEDVVDDLEGQARRLIDYCGLPWDDRCLDFHKNGRMVKTASSVQIRRPLFRSSLQRWRRYEAELGPLLDALGLRSDLAAAA